VFKKAVLMLAFVLVCGTTHAENLRVELGAGFNHGVLDADDSFSSWDVDGSIGTGRGYTLSARFWKDKIYYDWLSLGALYNFRQNNMNFDVDSDEHSDGEGSATLTANDFIFCVGARGDYAELSPYAYCGVGVSYYDISASTSGFEGYSSGETFAPTLVAGFGMDYDITDRYYVGAEMSYTYSFGDIVDVDVQHSSLGFLFKTGINF